MPLHWLCYHINKISVVIEPGASLLQARMGACLGGIDQSEFTEGHALGRSLSSATETVADGYIGFSP
jgi:hypothetical protein